MKLPVGARLKSLVGETQLIVVKTPSVEVALTCGGHPLVDLADPSAGGLAIEPGHEGRTEIGKRYADEDLGLELLCTKAGPGALFVNAVPLDVKQPKPLPSSD